MFNGANEATSFLWISFSIHSAYSPSRLKENGPRLRDRGRSREGRPLEAGRFLIVWLKGFRRG